MKSETSALCFCFALLEKTHFYFLVSTIILDSGFIVHTEELCPFAPEFFLNGVSESHVAEMPQRSPEAPGVPVVLRPDKWDQNSGGPHNLLFKHRFRFPQHWLRSRMHSIRYVFTSVSVCFYEGVWSEKEMGTSSFLFVGIDFVIPEVKSCFE